MEESLFRLIAGGICLLFPPLAAARYHEVLFEKISPVSSSRGYIFIAMGYLFVIIVAMAGMCILRGHNRAIYSDMLLTMNNLFKYGVTAFGLAVSLPNLLFCGCTFFIKLYSKRCESQGDR